jgi:DNA-directed RNA polymerase subunit L
VRTVDEMNVTEALLKAILELIEKCDTLDELRESVKRIMN